MFKKKLGCLKKPQGKPTNKTPNARHEKPCVAFGFLPEVEGKSPLLKTPCASDTGP